jgi:hypothetical protein
LGSDDQRNGRNIVRTDVRRATTVLCSSALFVWLVLAKLAMGQAPQIRVAERHVSGQTVAPVFEGWSANADGTASLWFGYLNRNYTEELDIPVGPGNLMEPGPDRGQPTHFLSRRHKMMFAVVVDSKTFGDKKIVWTLSIRGNTEKVAGSLNPGWQVDVDEDRTTGNRPPTVTVGPDQAITLPQTASLTVTVTDDGLPRPRRRRDGQADLAAPPPGVFADLNEGLTVEWSKYRGPGQVTFTPEKQAVVSGGQAATKATFTAPGDYVIQSIADDGSRVQGYHCCWTNGQIKVTVR